MPIVHSRNVSGIQVVYICSSSWLLAVESCHLSKAEKNVTVAKPDICSDLATVIFFSVWDKSRDLTANSQLLEHMQTTIVCSELQSYPSGHFQKCWDSVGSKKALFQAHKSHWDIWTKNFSFTMANNSYRFWVDFVHRWLCLGYGWDPWILIQNSMPTLNINQIFMV